LTLSSPAAIDWCLFDFRFHCFLIFFAIYWFSFFISPAIFLRYFHISFAFRCFFFDIFDSWYFLSRHIVLIFRRFFILFSLSFMRSWYFIYFHFSHE
jgi:hypothetical protein